MLAGDLENRRDLEASYRTAIGAAAGRSPRRPARGHQRLEAVFRHCRCLGAVAPAAMPSAAHSITPSPRALPAWPGTAIVSHPTGTGGVGREHPALADGGVG